MTVALNPYISFRDNARAAMTFYQEVFGGELALSTFGEYGDKDAPEAELIMHASLTTSDGLQLMGADTPPGMEYAAPAGITVSLSGDDDKLRGWFEKLAEGGDGVVAAGEADVGRRVRHGHRPVRHAVDGQRRRCAGLRAASST